MVALLLPCVSAHAARFEFTYEDALGNESCGVDGCPAGTPDEIEIRITAYFNSDVPMPDGSSDDPYGGGTCTPPLSSSAARSFALEVSTFSYSGSDIDPLAVEFVDPQGSLFFMTNPAAGCWDDDYRYVLLSGTSNGVSFTDGLGLPNQQNFNNYNGYRMVIDGPWHFDAYSHSRLGVRANRAGAGSLGAPCARDRGYATP